jgi:dTDP-4-dehydrorhamnose 3,5-epimerase
MDELYFMKHIDLRGSHMKFFTHDTASENGFNDVKEVFMTTNIKHVLRGLHRQTGDFPQQKIIKVVNGKFNVRVVYPAVHKNVVYSNHATKTITTTNNDTIVYFDNWTADLPPILVPNFALLGYLALEDDSKMLYIADNIFSKNDDEGYNAFDPAFSIDWGTEQKNIYQNERDRFSKNYYE